MASNDQMIGTTFAKVFFVGLFYILTAAIIAGLLATSVEPALAVGVSIISTGIIFLTWLSRRQSLAAVQVQENLELAALTEKALDESDPLSDFPDAHTEAAIEGVQPAASSEHNNSESDKDDPNEWLRTLTRYVLALLMGGIGFLMVHVGANGQAVNLLTDEALFDLSVGEQANEDFLPSLLVHDEMTHYFYARDVLSARIEPLTLVADGNIFARLTLLNNPATFVQLSLDEWGRPGNTLTYALASQVGFMARRWLSVALLIITTAEAIMIAQGLARHGKERPNLLYQIVIYLAVPALLWTQPWFYYFGVQSLSQVPFMLFMTMGVAAWLNGRYVRASICFGLLPITRHEALPLLLIWLLYLFRAPIWLFFKNLTQEIFNGESTNDPDNNPFEPLVKKKYNALNHRWRYVLITLLPYLLWNVFSLAYRNDAPLLTLFSTEGRAAYQAQEVTLFFAAAQEWIGSPVFALFISALVTGAVVGYVYIWHWYLGVSDNRNHVWNKIARNDLNRLFTVPDQSRHTTPISHYTWWLFFFGYFMIHVVIVSSSGNRFASGGYDFFILPIAPAVAVIASRSLTWPFHLMRPAEQSASQTSGTRQPSGIIWRGAPLILGTIGVVALFFVPLMRDPIVPRDYVTWLPTGESVRNPQGRDGEAEIGFDVGERRAMANHITAAQSLASGILKQLIEETVAAGSSPPLVITTNPVLRYALERAVQADNSDYPAFRICPAQLWNIDPQVALYPNLMPDGTIMVLDGRPDGGFQTNYPIRRRIDDGYRLQTHHLSSLFGHDEDADYGAFFGDWALAGSISPINLEADPNESDDIPRFWTNHGFALYQMRGTNLNAYADLQTGETTFTESRTSGDIERWRNAYAERYCGYVEEDERVFADVTVHHQAVYDNVGSLFLRTTPVENELAELSDDLVPVLDCTVEEALTDIAGCAVRLEDVAYIGSNASNETRFEMLSASLPDLEQGLVPLYVPPQSFLPVLECQHVTNRLQASWCLVVFPDTAFALDAESELSYTRNTVDVIAAADADAAQRINICDYTRISATTPPTRTLPPETLDSLRILPDVRRQLLLRPLPQELSTSDSAEIILEEDTVLYTDYGDYTPRWSPVPPRTRNSADPLQAEADAMIAAPGCFGWVRASRGRMDSNTVIVGEQLEGRPDDEERNLIVAPAIQQP